MDYIERAVAEGNLLDLDESTKPQSDSEGEFDYTQSRVVSLSDKHLKQNRILTDDTDQSIVSAYNVLRTRVLQRMQQNDWTTLAVTSPMPDDGKTLTAINLSISLARKLDYTVLLADLDFRLPGIHSSFGFEPEFGLCDYLAGRVKLEDVFVNPGINRLVILPGRESEKNSSEMLSSSKMQVLVDELKTRYTKRIIIFDLPPVLVGDDVLAFSTIADAVLLVARESKTTSDELARTVELLGTTNILGAVLNNSSAENELGYYGY